MSRGLKVNVMPGIAWPTQFSVFHPSYIQRSHFFYFAYPESRERSLGYTTQRMPDSISVHMIAASAAQWGERRIAPAGGEGPGSSRSARSLFAPGGDGLRPVAVVALQAR